MTYEIKLQVGSPHVLRDHLRVAIGHCTPGGSVRHTLEDALGQIEEQVKPAIEEPEAFGSIVRAVCAHGTEYQLWQRSPMQGKHYWESEYGIVEVWSDLTHVEVLRVGIGEPPPMTEEEIDESQATAQRNLSHGLQVGVLRCIGGMLDHPAHAMYCPAHGALRGKP